MKTANHMVREANAYAAALVGAITHPKLSEGRILRIAAIRGMSLQELQREVKALNLTLPTIHNQGVA